MHALDAMFEDQQKELSRWITRAQEIKNELRNTTMELYLARQGVRLRQKLAEKYQEIDALLQDLHIWKRAKKIMKTVRNLTMQTTAIGTRNGIPVYDPQHPQYEPGGHTWQESDSGQETAETEESFADNFTEQKVAGNGGPSPTSPKQDDADGYAQELYKLRDEQIAQEKGKTTLKGFPKIRFK